MSQTVCIAMGSYMLRYHVCRSRCFTKHESSAGRCYSRVLGGLSKVGCFLQNKLARVVIDRVPCLEMVRFVNSGTEACLSVLRLMRAFTGRNKVCY